MKEFGNVKDQDERSHRNEGSPAVAPDTRGWNFFEADQALQDILAIYLDAELLTHLRPHLSRLGWKVANELDEAAHLADRHPPILHQRDRFGRDQQWIEYHPAYRELEAAAYGEFAIHALSHRAGIFGWPEPYPVVAKHAFTYLFKQAEFGLGCPINVTDSGAHALGKFGDDDLKARFLPGMLTSDLDELTQSGQYMTEKEGGSDVGKITTEARLIDGEWRIFGEKWFCSNADAEVTLLLARPEGAPDGTKRLGLFIMPFHLEDGSQNAYRIVRLKDKMGTRSMASGEVILDGALAYPVGDLDRGIHQMLEMVNWSRLSNGVKSTALMRRAVHDATAVLRGRVVFGSALIEKPLARRQMLKIQLPAEQALSFSFFTADVLDKSEGYGGGAARQDAAAVLRMATPVLKFRATRDGRAVTGDALEMRGGIGYIEEFVNPRLVRDAHLGSIWEGAGNVVAIDALARAVRKHSCHEPFRASLRARLDDAGTLPASYVARLRDLVDKATAFVEEVGANTENEANYRQAASTLYHTATAVLLAWEGALTFAARGDARRALWSRLVVDHRLVPRDPFDAADTGWEDAVAERLLNDDPVSMDKVAGLLAG